MNKGEILDKEAIDKYGENTQIAILLEEISELQRELMKLLRNKGNVRAVSEKVADVEITLKQVHYIFSNVLLR